MKIITCFALLLISLPSLADETWISIADKSSIKFIASYDEVAFEGQFTKFSSEFIIHSHDFNNSHLKSTIDVTSVDTRSRDRDQALAEHDWFYFEKFPQANFISQSIKQIDDDQLQVQGTLTIRDQQKEIVFPMQWQTLENNQRQARAQISLDRRDFDIGIGEWIEDDTIGFDVIVTFNITYQIANSQE